MLASLTPRIRLSDFFAIFLPGLYIVATVTTELALVVPRRGPDLTLLCGNSGLTSCLTVPVWSTIVFCVFFVSYLFGSALRAIAMSQTDEMLWDVFHVGGSRISQESRDFPYATSVKRSSEALKCVENELSKLVVRVNIAPELAGTSLDERIYGYWKALLLQNAPEVFAYVSSFETRTRFFGGMFWAAAVALQVVAVIQVWAFVSLHLVTQWIATVAILTILVGATSLLLFVRKPGDKNWGHWRRRAFYTWWASAIVVAALSMHWPFAFWAIIVSILLTRLFGRNLRFARNSELCSFHQSYGAFVNSLRPRG